MLEPSPRDARAHRAGPARRACSPRAQRRRHARSRALGRDAPEPASWTASCRRGTPSDLLTREVVAVVRGDQGDGTDAGSLGFRLTRIRRRRRIRRGVGRRQIPRKRTRLVRLRVRRRHGVRAGQAVCHPSRPDHKGGLYVSKTIRAGACGATPSSIDAIYACVPITCAAVARALHRNPDRGGRPRCSTARSSRSARARNGRDCPTPPPGAWEIKRVIVGSVSSAQKKATRPLGR